MHQARIAAFVVCTTVALATPATADVLSEWNMCAQPIIATARANVQFGAGPAGQLDLATVHLAMHDAVQAYARRFEPYAGAINPGGGSAFAAAARAAHTLLKTRFNTTDFPPAVYPTLQGLIDGCYTTSMMGVVLPPAELDASNVVGDAAAHNVLLSRAGDGSFPSTPTPFAGGTRPGEWSPNPGTTSMAAPWGGNVRPFALDSLARCQVDPPPALHSFEYALNYIEVKLFGSATSQFRSAEQGAVARMFSGNFTGQYNQLFRDVAAGVFGGTDLSSLSRRARLFALTNMAMADAFICSWSAKTHFNFWRPAQAIRRGNEDGNILTVGDPMWTSYFSRNFNAAQHPNYSDYTSGANNITGATTRMLQLILGTDRFPFNIHALGLAVPLESGDPNPRVYQKFSDLANDVVNARIYLGIHFRFADVAGRSQGRRAAQYAFDHELEPIRKHGGHHNWDDDRDDR